MQPFTVLAPVLCVGAAVAAVLAWRQARTIAARLRRSRWAEGVVTGVEYNASQQVFPTVRFVTDGGRTVSAQPQSSTNARRFAPGQPVRLRYDPDDPQWIVVDGLPSASGTTYVAAVGLGVGAVVMAIAWWLVR
ncbi:MAG: DUF3592 domain-containing protein [Angustibacter sp.]